MIAQDKRAALETLQLCAFAFNQVVVGMCKRVVTMTKGAPHTHTGYLHRSATRQRRGFREGTCVHRRMRETTSVPHAVSVPGVVLVCVALMLPLTNGAGVTYQFREEQLGGQYVGNIERDMLLQSDITLQNVAKGLKYGIMASPDTRVSLFTINDTSSTISTTATIDREEVCPRLKLCQIPLKVAVYQQGANLDLFRIWDAVINISDVNDNAPAFPQAAVTLSVPESVLPFHVLHTSGAVDPDTGDNNGVKSYRLIQPSDMFNLSVISNPDGSTDLGIVILKQLDRESRDLYELGVVVMDGGFPQRTGTLAVNITVTDVNDNDPEFLQPSYSVTILENHQTNLPLLKVQARDLDMGQNAELTYVLSSRVSERVKTHILVDDVSGEIFARAPLDYEDDTVFAFVVEARDKGSPQLYSDAVVTVNVADVNDNAPQININLAPDGTNISEAEPVGKFIAHVSATDRDSGRNGLVICSMNDPYFSLHKYNENVNNMYKVLLKEPLDRETHPRVDVSIVCTDNGDPTLSNSARFTVYVKDVNDNPPAFSRKTYSGSVVENSPGGQSLLQVSAVDYDTGAGGEVAYGLEDAPGVTNQFSVDSRTGVITVLTPLNREDGAQRSFQVWASDRGSPRLSSTVTVMIEVEDQNDEKPYFTRSLFDCYILEKQPVGTRVGEVSARDADSASNANMRFSIVSGVGDAEYFAIEPDTGVLKSRAMFDREVSQVYKLQVKVQDPQVALFYDVANVTVQVLDDNDNPPVIHFPNPTNNTITVTYGTSVGQLLTTIVATDADDGVFGKIKFFIASGDDTHLFDLHQVSGGLRLARTILPSDVKIHHLEITAQDGGNPPTFHNAELQVVISSGNGTLAARTDKMDQNIVIVIILVCVTAVLAMAVVVTICLIRRIDREKQQRRVLSKAEEEKMFHLKNQDAFIMTSSDTSTGSQDSASSNGKNKKKEVSFSIDEGVGSLNTSSGSGNTLSTFKSPTEKRMDLHGMENCLSVTSATLRNDPGMLNIPVSHRMSADDNHLQTVHEEVEACQLMEMLKRNGEDALSASSGETGTSDSGRGGSEDDSHSNRGSAIDPDGSAMYQNTYPRGAAPSPAGSDPLAVRGRHPSGTRGSFHTYHAGSGRHGRQPSPHVTFSGNLQYLGESSTDRDDEFPPPPSPPLSSYSDLESDHHLDRPLSTFGQPRNNSYRSVVHSHPRYHAGYGGVATSLVKNSPMSSPTPPAPVSPDYVNGRQRWGSPSLNDDDDRTTSTTSGSYVINPEDFRKEMDELAFNDMIV